MDPLKRNRKRIKLSQYYVAFDESHKPRARIEGNYSELKNLLENNGYSYDEESKLLLGCSNK